MNKITTLNDIINKLDILTNAVLSNKNTLTLEECAAYIDVSVSHFYKLTSTQQIPHYKPRDKMVYFDRAELDSWLLQNRVATASEIEQKAANHLAGGLA
ncbi:MAG: helix-turn-helix domain-containing protein [Gallionella sp.]